MANFQIPAPPANKRPTDVYQWLGLIQKVLHDTKGVDWNANTRLTLKQICDSIGNDTNFNGTVNNRIETAITTTFTAQNILNKLKTVDGINSGLDADLVRGYVPVNKAGDTMTGFLTLHAEPTHAMHAATKQYVDSAIEGFTIKTPVKVATTKNETLSGVKEIDGIPTKEGDRVLVKDQTDKKQNGIYVVKGAAWERSKDGDTNRELHPGTYVFVNEGLLNKDSSWVLISDTVNIGTTDINFIQFSGAGQINAGTGLGKNGNTIFLKDTGVTAGTYTKLTVDAQGRVTRGTTLVASDIPNLDWSKITSGKPTTVQGYGITNAVRTDTANTINGTLTLNSAELLLVNSTLSKARLLAYTTSPNTVYLQSGTDANGKGNLYLSGMNGANLTNFSIKIDSLTNATINNSKILTTSDMGSGKNLDADKVDGLHASSFMRTDANTTTTGQVVINRAGSTSDPTLKLLSPNGNAPGIGFHRTGDGLRSWNVINEGGHLKFLSKLTSEQSFVEKFRLDTGGQVYISNNLVWHAGNDGSGSNLDADKLDGQHGDYYRNASNINAGTLSISRLESRVMYGDNDTWSTSEDNTASFKKSRSGFKRHAGNVGLNGFYSIHVANPTQSTGAYSAGISMAAGNVATGERKLFYYGYDAQEALNFQYEIWHSGRMGSGSGLDADKLDGKHYSDLQNEFVTRTGDSMTGFLTLHADPVNDLHAATKHYVDSVVQGMDYKQSVRVATTANLSSLSGLITIDSVTVVNGDRILVKDQTDQRLNGIYIANASNWTRANDANVIKKLNRGAYIYVEEGAKNAASGWVVDRIGSGDIGTATISFIQFSGTGQIIAGTGLGKRGNELYLTNTGVTSGTYTKLTVDAQGRVTTATGLSATDIPNLDWSKITSGKPTTIQGYGITNAIRTDQSGTINGQLTMNGGGGTLKLKPGSHDHVYVEFYTRTSTPTTRSAYIGYGNSGDTQLKIQNDIGDIYLLASNRNINFEAANVKSTGNFTIEKAAPKLILNQTDESFQTNRAAIVFRNPVNQNITLFADILDDNLPNGGYALRIKKTTDNAQPQFKADLIVEGKIYAGDDKEVWHQGNLTPSNYLLKSGGTMTGDLRIEKSSSPTIYIRHSNGTVGGSGRIVFENPAKDQSVQLEYNEHDSVRAPFGLHIKKASSNTQTTNKAYLDVEGDIFSNGQKVWHAGNDGSGSGLDADLLDGANSDVNASNNTIVKRGSDGSVSATKTKTNTVELGGKAQIVFNTEENSIDFILM